MMLVLFWLQNTLNDECVFKETLESTDFHTFVSHKYSGHNTMNLSHEWYLAIKRNGKAKHALNTSKRQKAAQFLVIAIRSDKDSWQLNYDNSFSSQDNLKPARPNFSI